MEPYQDCPACRNAACEVEELERRLAEEDEAQQRLKGIQAWREFQTSDLTFAEIYRSLRNES